jgi:two-component system, OmpR family, phosphate regulon sensor histidine kinase PhoR
MGKQLQLYFFTTLVVIVVLAIGLAVSTNPVASAFIFSGSVALIVAAFFYFQTRQQQDWDNYQNSTRNLVDQITRDEFDIEPVIDDMYFGELARLSNYIASLNDKYTQRNSQLEAILSSLRVGLVAIDLEGKIIFSNPRFNSMYHLRDDLRERHLISNLYDRYILSAINELDQVEFYEQKYIEQPNGLIYNYRAIAIVRDHQRVGKIVSVDNVTKVAKLDMMKQQFVSNVSHELKTPLTSIQGFAETLISMDKNDPKFNEFLQIISRESERLTNLINDILLLSEIENTTAAVSSKAINIKQVADDVVTLLTPQLKEAVALKVEVPTGITLKIEAFQLRQVLVNLMSNAIKYTEEGSISIQASTDKKRLLIQVIDTGIGIPDEDQGHVFERFYRVNKDRSRETGGTGLGLSIVKHIVESYRGQLNLESELGKGTTVTVVFPID